MFLGLRTVIYHAPDLAKAKDWYTAAFGVSRTSTSRSMWDSTSVGTSSGSILAQSVSIGNNAVAYWGVADIAQAPRMLEHGAEPRGPVMDVGEDIKVAPVADPFGNVIGLIENPHFKVR